MAIQIFMAGSRSIKNLSKEAKDRIKNVIEKSHHVMIGDAEGADTEIQTLFRDASYSHVTIYYSGFQPRNNIGQWNAVEVPSKYRNGFRFHAAKDKRMAQLADYGFMISDGVSNGTALNILRLLMRGKRSLVHLPTGFQVISTLTEWKSIFGHVKSIDTRMDSYERSFLRTSAL